MFFFFEKYSVQIFFLYILDIFQVKIVFLLNLYRIFFKKTKHTPSLKVKGKFSQDIINEFYLVVLNTADHAIFSIVLVFFGVCIHFHENFFLLVTQD